MDEQARQFWRNLLIGMAVGVVALAATVAVSKWFSWLVSLAIVAAGVWAYTWAK